MLRDVRIPEDWCHRTVLLSGGREHRRDYRRTSRPEPPKGKKVATASKKPEVQTKPDDGYQQMSLFGMGALI